jgi:ribonuclease G
VFLFQKIEDKKKRTLEKLYNPSNQKDLVLLFLVAEGKYSRLEKICRTCSRWTAMCKIPTAHHPSKFRRTQQSFFYIRDVLNDTFSGIQIDEELYNQTRITCKKLHHPNNQLLSFINQRHTYFLKYNIETNQNFWKTVSMSKGAYLIIEHTEALHVIDVNSGNRSNTTNQEKIPPWKSI